MAPKTLEVINRRVAERPAELRAAREAGGKVVGWIGYPEPQVLFGFHGSYTWDLVFAYAVSTSDAKPKPEPVTLERVKGLGGIKDGRGV